MKRITIFAVAVATTMTMQAQRRAIPRDEGVERQVEQKLAQMTLDEKIGQMCELTIDVITDRSAGEEFRLDEAALARAFNRYKVGSILNVPKSLAQTPEVWATLIRRLNQLSAEAESGVPQVYGVDQIHGASYTWGATLFPQEVGQAASFNRSIPRRIHEIAAYESRAGLIPWVYSPVMDLGRNPLWSRMWESYGEDAYLSAEMAREAVLGYQGDDPNHIGPERVAACVKHFMAYGVPVNGKDRTPSSVSERDLREKYFEPFRRAIEAGALSLMVNSGVNNGMPFHANHELLTVWLKEQLGWDGMIVTDWADINNLYTRDHVAGSKKEAIALAINAGIDMSMVPYETDFCDLLRELVNEGRVPMERIDDAVRRVLRMKVRLGSLDRKTWDLTPKQLAKRFPDFASERFAAEARTMTEECMVLLKNEELSEGHIERLLPLKEGTRILVCGPNANNWRTMNGGWSYTWQGDRTNEVAQKIGRYHTFYTALRERFGSDNVALCEGTRWASGGNWQKEEASPVQSSKFIVHSSDMQPNSALSTMDFELDASQLASYDVIVACIGENSYCETPGNTDDLELSANQTALVKALARTGKPIVLVLNEGRPRLIRELEPLCKAIVHTFLPSNYGGDALARLLSGDANFSGRMPYTYPRHAGSLTTYDHKPCENTGGQMEGNYNYEATTDVQWPFGYGLSYTTFRYSNLRVDHPAFAAGDSLTFTVDVTNTGQRVGKESVLLYVSDLVASLTPDVRRLRAFEKVELKPGETQTVALRIAAQDLAFVGYDNHWRLEEGDFRATVGTEALQFRCTETKRWESANR
ncbi:MAG: glycoside hydrolase family 3 C-terminal domain-containing protein [Bacteroidaceae bacterium]|nr:glycoside hydrolase family 3 C-terminal domain-containing protein [Bacteroidaceae bacterium]